MEGGTDFGRPGYGGPCPHLGTHRYFFKLSALDTKLALPKESTKKILRRQWRGTSLSKQNSWVFMREDKIKEFQNIIRGFYEKNRRDFPWRNTRDPYKIFVSEVMLQQTQVSRVLLKYPEFIKVFPTLKSLAKAPFSDVLRVWQGLGYNRRARALKSASEAIWGLYKGKIPKDIEQLLGLPGIGPSTAGGILAFAYDTPISFYRDQYQTDIHLSLLST